MRPIFSGADVPERSRAIPGGSLGAACSASPETVPVLARDYAAPLHRIGGIDPAFTEELNMRLLIRVTAAWM